MPVRELFPFMTMPVHNANQIQDLIGSFACWQLEHPPYNSDVAYIDYHMYLQFKMHLGCERHDDENTVKTCCCGCQNQTTVLYEDDI